MVESIAIAVDVAKTKITMLLWRGRKSNTLNPSIYPKYIEINEIKIYIIRLTIIEGFI